MDTKTVWQCDGGGNLMEEIVLSKDTGDLGKDGWLIPAGCVEEEPPEMKEGFLLCWSDEQWSYKEIPEPVKEEVTENKVDLQEVLNFEFIDQKRELLEAYLTAQIRGDIETQEEIQEELRDLEVDYAQKREMIEQGQNPWEAEVE